MATRSDKRGLRFAPVVLVLLSGCAGGGDRFAGTLTTDQGACGPGFDSAGKATSSLVIRAGKVQFAPSDGVLVLDGQENTAGHVTASSNAIGADRKPFPQVFEGDRTGDRITGKFATPRCRASVVMTRQ